MNLFIRFFLILVVCLVAFVRCSDRTEESKDEHLKLEKKEMASVPDSLLSNVVKKGLTIAQMSTYPYLVELTGLSNHRLITVYKKVGDYQRNKRSSSYDEYGNLTRDYDASYTEQHFMPGLDLVHGYNLVNIAHYDLAEEKINYLFASPALIKSLYYPSFVQDSVEKKPIIRDYYLVSVYDEDTNKDTLINKVDLRRFYCFSSSGDKRIQLLPPSYSVVRSQYDIKNDVMYIFAKHDENGNGEITMDEQMHLFWISLKQPAEAKRMY
jgi:hypothetical protein